MNFSRSALFHKKTRICLKYSVNGCLCKQFFARETFTRETYINKKQTFTRHQNTKRMPGTKLLN